MKNKLKNFKNKFSLFLSFLFLFQLILFNFNNTAFAATTPSVSYTVTGETKIGNTIEIAVNISNVTDLYGGSIDFVYDTSLLEIQSVTKGNIFGSNTVLTPLGSNGKVENGQASFSISLKGDKDGVNGNGTLAIIKAKVLKEGTVKLNTTNSNKPGLSLGGDTVRVKLSNSEVENIDYSPKNTSFNLGNNKPLTAGLHQENSSNLIYKGTWYNNDNSKHSSGSSKHSVTAGDSIEFSFTGTGLNILSYSNAYRGIAKIIIDGVEYSADGYSPSDTFQKNVFKKRDLANTTHNVKILVTNDKNLNSRGIAFSLDAIEIFNTTPEPGIKPLTAGLHQENSSNLIYKGTWYNNDNSKHSSGSSKHSVTSGDSIEFSFTGTGLNILSYSNAYRGIAKIIIDGVEYSADGYSPSDTFQKNVFEKRDLANTTHNVKILVTNDKNLNSRGIAFSLDAIEIFNTTPEPGIKPLTAGLHQENSSNLIYKGTWYNNDNSKHSSGSSKHSVTSGDSIEFSFTGTGLNILSYSNAYRGIAKIIIDGVEYSADGYSPSDTFQKNVFKKRDLANTTHNVKILVTNDKNLNSRGIAFSLDAIEIFNTTPEPGIKPLTAGLHQENSSNLIYKGTWYNNDNSKHSSGSSKHSVTSGDSIEFSFTGTGLNILSYSNAYRGIAKIIIDGVEYSADGYSPSDTFQKNVFEKRDLANTTHNVKILVTNDKNLNSRGIAFSLDAIEIFNTTPEPGIKPLTAGLHQENSSNLIYKGTWYNNDNSKHSSGSSKHSVTSGDSIEFSFTGTGLNILSYSNAYRGIAKIIIDGVEYSADGYSPSDTFQKNVFEKRDLANTTHNVKILVTNDKNLNSRGIAFSLDAIKILN